MKNKINKAASRARKRIEDHNELKKQQNKATAAFRERKRTEDHDGMKR